MHKKATIHQVTTMLATSKDVLFPGHNHLLTTITDDARVIIKMKRHHYILLDVYEPWIYTSVIHTVHTILKYTVLGLVIRVCLLNMRAKRADFIVK